jgi:membrane dipeptidase
MKRTTDLIASNLVWDNHGCMPLRPFDENFLPQLERYRAVGVDIIFLNVGFGEQGIEEHVRVLAHFRRWLSLRSGDYLIVETVDDVERARKSGRLAVGFNLEGANGIADQLSLIQLYYDLGVRWMLMAYNLNNRVGGGCQDEDIGLTAFGREVIDEMARVGMVACCSHTGYRTALDVMAYSKKPVIFSHSNPRAIYDHPRNITDEMIRACADTDGVVGVNGIGIFLGDNDNNTDTYVRHVDHVAGLVGARHVGIGLDYVFDMGELDDYLASMKATFPEGLGYEAGAGLRLVEPERIAEIADRLLAMNYSDDDVKGILGGNFMRVAKAVWRPASPSVDIS